jgi:hypothetical protein
LLLLLLLLLLCAGARSIDCKKVATTTYFSPNKTTFSKMCRWLLFVVGWDGLANGDAVNCRLKRLRW